MSRPPSPSGDQSRWTAAALITIVAALAVLRLLAAQSIHLTEDEAYYRLWAQRPALGYYDHPPMVAWWIWAGVRIAGDTALGVRLLPVASSLLTTLMVFDIGQSLGSRRTGLTAVLLYNATLTVGAGAILAIPDVPASLFWVLALWALVRTRQSPCWWLLAGAAAGMACLSKYSALFLAPGVLLWLALTPEGRRRLRSPWPWAAMVVAAAIFSANVSWNAHHHWLTFAKQFGRVSPGRFAPRYLGEFLGAQFALLNPAVAILAGAGVVKAWTARDAGIPRLAAATSAPFLLYLLLHSLHDRVQAHWPVPLYPAAALLAAFAAEGASGWRKRLVRVAPMGIALTAIALSYAALPRGLMPKGDPADALRGWSDFAAQVDGVRAATGATWVGTLSYGVDAQLQAEQTLAAPVVQLNERERYGPAMAGPDLTKPGLVVDLLRRVDIAKLKACFAEVGEVVEIDRGSSREADARYVAIPVSGPKVDLVSAGCPG